MPHITTSDGVSLSYTDTGGSAPVLLMLHGWSQSGAMFKRQVEGLRERYRVVTLDFRGHGESEKTSRGYRISRFAKDVDDAIKALELTDITLLGWSMGCSVAWCYWDLFDRERIRKLVLVDQAPWLLPSYSIYENEPHTLDTAMLDRLYSGLVGADAEAFSAGFFKIMHTTSLPSDEAAWLFSESLKLPRKEAALLLLDHICSDWRDVIPTINVPTLVIGGRASLIKWKTQEWISRQIADSGLVVFEEGEGGGHLMFWENAEKFNAVVKEFIG
jgi:non-heme chloroperoxidase